MTTYNDDVITKTPAETKAVTFDASELLASGDSISAASVTILDAADQAQAAMVSGSASVSGALITQMIAGGSDGQDYTLTLSITTADGETLSTSVLLKIRSATGASLTDTWATVQEANAYMQHRLGAADYWHPDAPKEEALVTAYHQLRDCGLFIFPKTATADMKRMQFEQALFLLMDQGSIDLRAGLRAQGVVSAGTVKESYRSSGRVEIPIAPAAAAIGERLYQRRRMAFGIDLERNEEEDVL